MISTTCYPTTDLYPYNKMYKRVKLVYFQKDLELITFSAFPDIKIDHQGAFLEALYPLLWVKSAPNDNQDIMLS